MKTLLAPALSAMVLLVAACEEPKFEMTQTDRVDELALDDFWTMQDSRGIPVEVHGTPFRRITDQEIVSALRAPEGAGENVRFYPSSVGTRQETHPWRLVLHFNPQGGPNAFNDCKLVEEAKSNPHPRSGYTVNLSFCHENQWRAHGHQVVPEIEDGDLQSLGQFMQAAMAAIFAEKS